MSNSGRLLRCSKPIVSTAIFPNQDIACGKSEGQANQDMIVGYQTHTLLFPCWYLLILYHHSKQNWIGRWLSRLIFFTVFIHYPKIERYIWYLGLVLISEWYLMTYLTNANWPCSMLKSCLQGKYNIKFQSGWQQEQSWKPEEEEAEPLFSGC